MSSSGVKTAKAVAETDSLEPQIFYGTKPDWKEWQARRLRLLWSLRRIPLVVFAACAFASIVIPFCIRNTYVATAQLMPPETSSSTTSALVATLATKAGPMSGVASDFLNLKTSAGLFIGVLISQNVQDQLVKQFDLVKVYKASDEEEAQARLNDNTFIREDKTSGLIDISVTDFDPVRAAAIANAYVDRLNGLVAQLSTSSAHRERIFLEERLKVVKQDLDSATNQLAEFSSNTVTLDPEQEGKAMLDAAGNITAQLIAAESQLEGLKQIYTDRHPRVRGLNARVGELRRQLQQLGGNPLTATAQNGKEAAGSSEQSSSVAYPSIRSLPLLGAKYSDYYRHIKIQEAVYELLTSQYELAKVQEAKEIPAIKVLDVAKPPRRKASPHRLLLIELGMFVSFGVATVCWLLGMLWKETDPLDPRLIVLQDLLGPITSQLPWSTKESARSASLARENIVSPLRKGRVRPSDETFD